MADWRRARKLPVEVSVRGPILESEMIETLEGNLQAAVGDFVVRGVDGELYPVKPAIFARTYEPVD